MAVTIPLTMTIHLHNSPVNDIHYYIGEMDLCHWQPLGMFGSCWIKIPGWSYLRVDWTDAVAIRCTLKFWRKLCNGIGGLVTHRGVSGRASKQPMSASAKTWECRPQALERQPDAWEHLWTQLTSLGVHQFTVEQSVKNNIFFRNVASAPGNCCYYSSFNNF